MLSIIAESKLLSPLKWVASSFGIADEATAGGTRATTPLTRSGCDDCFTRRASEMAMFAPADWPMVKPLEEDAPYFDAFAYACVLSLEVQMT